jgi:serine-type D-Ala-D-Ala carboxypeptidase (penicillin-binding protein 5/6)
MLTSLLTFYIAKTIDVDLQNELPNAKEVGGAVVKTANFNVSKIIESIPIPSKNPGYISPILDAKGIIVMDRKTGKILFENNAHQRMPIASITKLMTILIILEENNLNDIVTISSNAANVEGSQMYLQAGEQISVEKLLNGALIGSANDGALSLAEYNAGTVEAFVEKMNKRALELGLINTKFSNPIGLDSPNNYSSPYDIAKLGNFIYNSEFVQQAANTKEMEVKSESGKFTHKLENTNDLLDSYLGIKGLKTGKTDAAGLCLIGVSENSQENEIITVVLNSPDRFKETKILTDWSFRAYTWY